MNNAITVFNMRSGFANNSSSTHSVIFFPTDEYMKDIHTNATTDFGWDFFTVSTPADIKNYLAATLRGNIKYDLSNQYVSSIVKDWCGLTDYPDSEAYVDHQSMICLPYLFDESGVDRQYFESVQNILLQPNVVVLGGNDNEDNNHTLEEKFPEFTVSMNHAFMTDRSQMVGRYDEVYDYWTLFSRRYGNRVRMKFTNTGVTPTIPTKSSTPDLVDIKITNFCTANCNFCYQGSTSEGKHANISDIRNLIRTLSNNEVFEIAFGGGEPTSHPDFIEILKYTREQYIIPNFTTKNLKWVREHVEEIRDTIGSFAYSITNAYEVKPLAVLRDYHNLPNHMCCVQVVMNTITLSALEYILKACAEHAVPITLLGFKELERGVKYRKIDNTGWLDLIKKLRGENIFVKVGIDTALIQQNEELLKEANIPQVLYHKDEGMFSWYIDAVDKKQGPSSYHETKKYDHIYSEFIEEYQSYQA